MMKKLVMSMVSSLLVLTCRLVGECVKERKLIREEHLASAGAVTTD